VADPSPIDLPSRDVLRLLRGGSAGVCVPVAAGAGPGSWPSPELLSASREAHLSMGDDGGVWALFEHPRGGPSARVRCPFGPVGASLWVREAFARRPGAAAYLADGARWEPAERMPRELSRVDVVLRAVSVGRLHDRSPGGAALAAEWDEAYGASCPWALDPWVWRLGLWASPRPAAPAVDRRELARALAAAARGDLRPCDGCRSLATSLRGDGAAACDAHAVGGGWADAPQAAAVRAALGWP